MNIRYVSKSASTDQLLPLYLAFGSTVDIFEPIIKNALVYLWMNRLKINQYIDFFNFFTKIF